MDAPVTPRDATPSEPPTLGRHARVGRWPFGILAVAVLRLVNAAMLAAVGLGVEKLPFGAMPVIGNDSALTRAIDLGLAALVVVGVVGLLAFRRWGWVLTMLLVGLSLMGDLIRTALGEPDYVSLLLHVLAAFYLNGRSVRAMAFERTEPDEQLRP